MSKVGWVRNPEEKHEAVRVELACFVWMSLRIYGYCINIPCRLCQSVRRSTERTWVCVRRVSAG